MTVASTFAFDPAVTDLITEMYRDLDVIGDDEVPTAAQYRTALFKLNSVAKSLEATGIHVWTEEEAILFLQPGIARYTLGYAASQIPGLTGVQQMSVPMLYGINETSLNPNGVDGNCSYSDQYVLTELNASYAAGATAILVISTFLINSGDLIGIVVDTGATFWTTVASPPMNNIVTLSQPLPVSASSGNFVMDYPVSAQIQRPLKVPKARLLTLQGVQETPMTGPLSRQEYMDLPNKTAQGVPTQWFYTPQRDVGYLYVWPVPTMSAWAIRFTWYRPLADFLTPDNTMDFPQEWVAPLRWLLADEMRIGHSLPPQRQQMIMQKAAEWMVVVTSWDRESEPIQFGIDWQYR